MKLGFIGCGNMAQALAKGLVKAKVYAAADIILSDTQQSALTHMENEGFATTTDNIKLVQNSDVIILAVKPKDVAGVLYCVQVSSTEPKLLVSICAGITLNMLDNCLPTAYRNIRVMPNVCCLVGESASCFARSAKATQQDCALVQQIFSSVGRCYEVEEQLMHAVIGVSGSGPAFIFVLIDAMADAGVKGGLSRDLARSLAAQTVLGSAKMILESGKHPAELKDQVASPGGTTIMGLAELERTGLRNSIISAIDVARIKSEEMSKPKTDSQ